MASVVDLVHRQLWQRLPQAWRRTALFRATSLIAPRPTIAAIGAGPIIVAGALRTASGLGQAARLCHDALRQAGLPVFGVDLTELLRQPSSCPDFAFDRGHALSGPGTLILFVNAPLVPLAMWHLGRRLILNKRIVGYWAWELPTIPDEWRHGMPFVHEVWTPTRFVADAVRPLAGNRRVHVLPYPVAIEPIKVCARHTKLDRPFTVLSIFNMDSSFARKNPCAAINAFRWAFGDDPGVRLIVKTANTASFKEGLSLMQRAKDSARNVIITDQMLTSADMTFLYDQSEVLLSLHRSEGFGLTMAEAMLHGLAVIATDWSGNTDFLNRDTGIPIPYHLIPAQDAQATYHHPDMMWAEANVEAAARALRQLREDRGLLRQLGQQAASIGANIWSVERHANAVRRHLGL